MDYDPVDISYTCGFALAMWALVAFGTIGYVTFSVIDIIVA